MQNKLWFSFLSASSVNEEERGIIRIKICAVSVDS